MNDQFVIYIQPIYVSIVEESHVHPIRCNESRIKYKSKVTNRELSNESRIK
jgi:hypothetical protein